MSIKHGVGILTVTRIALWLKRMYFFSNFRRLDEINLGKHLQVSGEPLWLGEVLRADELSRRMA